MIDKMVVQTERTLLHGVPCQSGTKDGIHGVYSRQKDGLRTSHAVRLRLESKWKALATLRGNVRILQDDRATDFLRYTMFVI